MAEKKLQYRLNVYQYTSGRKIGSSLFASKENLLAKAKDLEKIGFKVDYNTLENRRRKYSQYNENIDDLRYEKVRKSESGKMI